jgi:hypothetical protein
MLNDVPFEAAFLRTAILVGLFHEREAPEWAAALLHPSSVWAARLAEVAAARVELSAVRAALRPIAAGADSRAVARAILSGAALDLSLQPRTPADAVSMLGQIRQECRLPTPEGAPIKAFENRAMFAAFGVPGQALPTTAEITATLAEISQPGFYRVYFEHRDDLIAFVAAMSRQIARGRTGTPSVAATRAWLLKDPAGHADAVVVDESAIRIAARESAPLPPASRIPYASAGSDAIVVLDDSTSALGADEVRERVGALL